jgi:carboxymethylenebutenolidase
MLRAGSEGAAAPVRKLRHLTELGVEHDVKSYAGTGHGFMTPGHSELAKLAFLPMRLGYEPQAAEDAWSRLFAFFDPHVRGCG